MASSKDIYRVTVHNFAKHNKKLRRGYDAVLIQRDLATHPKLLAVPHTTRWMYLGLILMCDTDHAGVVQETVTVSAQYLQMLLTVRVGVIQALDQLKEIQLVTYEKVDSLLNKTNKKQKKIKEIKQSEPPTQPSDVDLFSSPNSFSLTEEMLESVYAAYPRKEGKKQGFKIAYSELKSQADLDDLKVAIARYRAKLSAEKTESKFTKHFSTFMNSWRECLDPDYGKSSTKAFESEREHDFDEEIKALNEVS